MYEENTFELYAYLFLGWALSTLSAVAAVTNGIRLGTSILNIVVRSPVICVKSLAAIDILSSGRLFAAGVGPGSHKGDYDVCGIPFEERWSRFNEALEILHILWNNGSGQEEREIIIITTSSLLPQYRT